VTPPRPGAPSCAPATRACRPGWPTSSPTVSDGLLCFDLAGELRDYDTLSPGEKAAAALELAAHLWHGLVVLDPVWFNSDLDDAGRSWVVEFFAGRPDLVGVVEKGTAGEVHVREGGA
jgi:hypothetical protein